MEIDRRKLLVRRLFILGPPMLGLVFLAVIAFVSSKRIHTSPGPTKDENPRTEPVARRDNPVLPNRETAKPVKREVAPAKDATMGNREPDDEEGWTNPRRRTIPGTERDYYENFKDLGGERLAEMAQSTIGSDVYAPEKVAMLRALYDTNAPNALDIFALALQTLSDKDSSHGVSVPAFAIRFLAKNARRDERIGPFLESQVWGGALQDSPPLRRQAVAAIFTSVNTSDLSRLADRLYGESDLQFVETAAAAMRARHPSESTRVLEALARNHPNGAIRERVQGIIRRSPAHDREED